MSAALHELRPVSSIRRGVLPSRSPRRPLRLAIQPGTICVLGFVAVMSIPPVVGMAGLMPLLFPALALATAAVLLALTPGGYLAFVWWIWLLSPFVRRLVDWQLGWAPISTIMLTPYLVTALCAITLVRRIGDLATPHLIALCLAVAGVAYAFVIGLGSVGVAAASFGFLTWIVPILFGFHLAASWRSYDLWRDTTRSTFAYGLIVIAAYGVLQFALLPPWDAYWMAHAGMSSIGQPLPFRVRVFSTLNAPGVFASFVMAGLLVGFGGRGKAGLLAAQPLVWLAFLLGQVRSAWLGYGLGLCLIMIRLPLARGARIALLGLGLVVAVLPMLQLDAVEEVVMTRLASFSAGQSDHSLQERMQLYARFFNVAVDNVPGGGIGSTNLATKLSNNGGLGALGTIDSGILELLYTFGWPGTLLFASGLGLALTTAMRTWSRPTDPFSLAALAVAVSLLAQMLFFNTLIGAVGLIFWTMLGLVLASQRIPARRAGERAHCHFRSVRPAAASAARVKASP